MRVSESLGMFSVESFLADHELADVIAQLDRRLEAATEVELSELDRPTSVHHVPGISLQDTMRAYEPAGRIELAPPDGLVEILDAAAARALPAVQNVFPSAIGAEAWTYLEYGVGQHITAHIDHPIEWQPGDQKRRERPTRMGEVHIDHEGAHVAGISLVLNSSYEGGEFFVETSSAADLWRGDWPELAREGADYTSDWFPRVARTRWRARPSAGDAVLYGTQLIHGTEPITSGRVGKIIGFFVQ